jgi:hypothetical protein
MDKRGSSARSGLTKVSGCRGENVESWSQPPRFLLPDPLRRLQRHLGPLAKWIAWGIESRMNHCLLFFRYPSRRTFA